MAQEYRKGAAPAIEVAGARPSAPAVPGTSAGRASIEVPGGREHRAASRRRAEALPRVAEARGVDADWAPEGFADYRARWPDTPAFAMPERDRTEAFAEAWRADDPARLRFAKDTTIAFVRGYLGNYMPGNLVGPARSLSALGFDAYVVGNRSGVRAEDNAPSIAQQLRGRSRDRLILCGHSKGGLEALLVLRDAPDLAAKCVGVALSQTPRGPSRVLESLLLHAHQETLSGPWRRAAEHAQRMGLYAIGAVDGGLQLTAERVAELVAAVEPTLARHAVLQTASWSSRPTTWLDSFHERLEEVRPRCAHDGQFYLEDLLWPGLPHVLLPHLDHAQPAVGGFGFDEARYWRAIVAVLVE
jgi:hypothetical protein